MSVTVGNCFVPTLTVWVIRIDLLQAHEPGGVCAVEGYASPVCAVLPPNVSLPRQ